MLLVLPLAYTPPSPFMTPPMVPPALEPLPADWATAERLDVLNMTGFNPADCASIQPRVYADTWCVSACAINFCLEDICACGEDAKEKSAAIDKKNMDNWQGAEDKQRAGQKDGCTVVDCPNGLASDVGKQANETSVADQEYQNAIDNWKEGEEREKAVDPKKAYPFGLPPASQQKQQQQQQADENRPTGNFVPPDPSTCKSIMVMSVTDEWCMQTCQRACPPKQCKCDDEPTQESGYVPTAPSQVPAINRAPEPPTAAAPCVSIGPTQTEANDRWCNLSCVNINGNCPATVCECDEEKLKKAQAGITSAQATSSESIVADRDAGIASRDQEVASRKGASPSPSPSPQQ
jgi:hypothetical protein